ncbi:MAG: hypothetical protein ACRDSZ_07660 [Pseudonocardiaceae bacterium]
MIESERAFESIDSIDAEPERARFIDNAYLSSRWADTFVERARPVEAARFARRSISAAADHNRVRREALNQSGPGQGRTGPSRSRRRTARCASGGGPVHHRAVLALYRAVRDLRSRISPYRAVTGALEFDDRVREVLTQAHLN